MSAIPASVIQIRRECCAQAGCVETPAYHDPCASCPAGHWGPYTRCAQDEPPLPPLPEMAMNYVAAQTDDLLAGRPRRTRDEAATILQTHCNPPGSPCPHYRPSDGRCSLCGCPVRDKIPMARQHCPIGKW